LDDLVQDDNPALARVARKTTPAAALAALGIVRTQGHAFKTVVTKRVIPLLA